MPLQTLLKTAVTNSDRILTYKTQRVAQHGGRGLLQMVEYPSNESSMVISDDEPEPAVQAAQCAPPGEREFHWDCSGCLNIPGQKHIMDNVQGDLVKKMAKFKQFQEQLSAVNTLMHQKFYRDRVRALMSGTPFVKLFESHRPGSLALWRWGSLVEVCSAFHKLEGALRSHWNLKRFLSVRGGDEDDGSDLFARADSAIRSPFFWAYLKFVLLIHGVINDLSSWCEGCPCHGFSSERCILRGRRAPELASGMFIRFLTETFATASSMFTAVASGLGESSQEWEALSKDWNCACDIAVAALHVKTSHWSQLPWLLCGLGMADPEAGRAAGRKAVELYQSCENDALSASARRHPMTQRFLKPNGELHLGCFW